MDGKCVLHTLVCGLGGQQGGRRGCSPVRGAQPDGRGDRARVGSCASLCEAFSVSVVSAGQREAQGGTYPHMTGYSAMWSMLRLQLGARGSTEERKNAPKTPPWGTENNKMGGGWSRQGQEPSGMGGGATVCNPQPALAPY